MEAIPLILAIALILGAIGYRFTFGLRKATGQTAKTQVVMLSMIGSGSLILGVLGAYDIAASKRIWTEGIVTYLRRTRGKGAHSTFRILSPDGKIVQLDANYTGANLINGERVRVRYYDRTNDITDLTVLDGPRAGWNETESGGVFQSAFELAFAAFLLGAAYRVHTARKPNT